MLKWIPDNKYISASNAARKIEDRIGVADGGTKRYSVHEMFSRCRHVRTTLIQEITALQAKTKYMLEVLEATEGCPHLDSHGEIQAMGPRVDALTAAWTVEETHLGAWLVENYPLFVEHA